jgi:hypothetical protein
MRPINQTNLNHMKKRLSTHPEPLKQLAVAVATTATTFGLVVASACMEGSSYYITYRTPNGYLIRTEANTNPRTALFAFEKALFNSILNNK